MEPRQDLRLFILVRQGPCETGIVGLLTTHRGNPPGAPSASRPGPRRQPMLPERYGPAAGRNLYF
jgi:hypothetical protein